MKTIPFLDRDGHVVHGAGAGARSPEKRRALEQQNKYQQEYSSAAAII